MPNTVFPLSSPTEATAIYSTAGAERTLAASGAYERSDLIVRVEGQRVITLTIAYDAAGVGGYPVIIPLVSNAGTKPAAGDDAWSQMPINDGTWTNTVLSGALASGSDFTQNPGVGLTEVRGLALKPMAAAVGATDEVRISVPLQVAGFRWFQFQIAEVGNTGAPGAALVTYSLTV